MDNIENNNVIQEQFEQQNDEIQFNYGDTTESKPNFELKKGDMIFAGLALFAIGWILCFRKKNKV